MKRLSFIFLVLSNFLNISKASVLIVSNMNSGASVYSVFDSAMTAANNGDTIYLQAIPSNINITIIKSITLVGRGYAPDVQNQIPTQLVNISLDAGVSNVTVSGIKMNTFQFGSNNNFVQIYRCLINSVFLNSYVTNSSVSNCVFPNGGNSIYSGGLPCTNLPVGLANLNFMNNIFYGIFVSLPGNNHIIRNNIFLSNGNSAFAYCGFDSPTLVQNNIFYGMEPSHPFGIFQNNIVFGPPGIGVSNLGGSNLDSINPMFVNVPLYSTSFSFANDYHLQSNSPGHNAGTDGTDIGIYGGNLEVNLTGEPLGIPVIRKMDVQNFNVPSNSTLNLHVISTKSR